MPRRKAPEHLSEDSQKLWSKIVEQYRIADAASLSLLTTAMAARDRMEEARAIIDRDGLVYHDRFGQAKSHPLIVVERDARSAYLAAMRACNLEIMPLNPAAGRPGGK